MHSRCSGMDHTVLPLNHTMPASTSWVFTRRRHHWLWKRTSKLQLNTRTESDWLVDLQQTVYPHKWSPVSCRLMQDRESSLVKDQHYTTVACNQHNFRFRKLCYNFLFMQCNTGLCFTVIRSNTWDRSGQECCCWHDISCCELVQSCSEFSLLSVSFVSSFMFLVFSLQSCVIDLFQIPYCSYVSLSVSLSMSLSVSLCVHRNV